MTQEEFNYLYKLFIPNSFNYIGIKKDGVNSYVEDKYMFKRMLINVHLITINLYIFDYINNKGNDMTIDDMISAIGRHVSDQTNTFNQTDSILFYRI